MPKTARTLAVAAVAAVLSTAAPLAQAAESSTIPQSSAAQASTAKASSVEVCGQGSAVVKPGSMILTCADDGELAKNLDWTSWTAQSATATGLVTWRSCAADCAHATTWDSTTAHVTLADPVSEPGKGTLFTKLELRVTGPTPHGFQRSLTFDETPLSLVRTQPQTQISSPAAPKTMQPATAPSGSLGFAQIEGYWVDAGGPSSVAETAAAITGAESSFDPGIIQSGVDYCGAGADRAGWGLWQITCGNSVPADGSDFQLLDPWNNAEAAVSKYDADVAAGDNGFDPWSTYTSGAYENFLRSTAPDTAITDPGQYTQINATPSGTPTLPAAAPGSTYGPTMPGTTSAPALTTKEATGNSSGMQVSHDEGASLAMLVRMIGARPAIEVGVFTGYSSLCIARGLPEDGRLLSCDISDEWTSIGKPFWERAGVADRIDLKIGPAIETLRALPLEPVYDKAASATTARWNGRAVARPSISNSASARAARCNACKRLSPVTISLASMGSQAWPTTLPWRTPESRRTPGPDGGDHEVIVPGAGRKLRPGSSALIRNSKPCPRDGGSG